VKEKLKKCSMLNKRGVKKIISSRRCSMSRNYHASCIKNAVCHGLSLSMVQHTQS